LIPLTLKDALLMLVDEMVTDDPPVLVSVSERLDVFPVCTSPKASAEGDPTRALLTP
jgi:hypothetical protein